MQEAEENNRQFFRAIRYIRENNVRWSRYEIDLYLLRQGFDPKNIEDAWVTIVKKGQVIQVTCTICVPKQRTANDLFEVAREAAKNKDWYNNHADFYRVEMRFDPIYGFPKFISSKVKDSYDMSWSLEVKSFEILED